MGHVDPLRRLARRPWGCRGFTLVEMLVVIGVLVILFTLLFIPMLLGFNVSISTRRDVETQNALRAAQRMLTRDLAQAWYVFPAGANPTDPRCPITDPRYPELIQSRIYIILAEKDVSGRLIEPLRPSRTIVCYFVAGLWWSGDDFDPLTRGVQPPPDYAVYRNIASESDRLPMDELRREQRLCKWYRVEFDPTDPNSPLWDPSADPTQPAGVYQPDINLQRWRSLYFYADDTPTPYPGDDTSVDRTYADWWRRRSQPITPAVRTDVALYRFTETIQEWLIADPNPPTRDRKEYRPAHLLDTSPLEGLPPWTAPWAGGPYPPANPLKPPPPGVALLPMSVRSELLRVSSSEPSVYRAEQPLWQWQDLRAFEINPGAWPPPQYTAAIYDNNPTLVFMDATGTAQGTWRNDIYWRDPAVQRLRFTLWLWRGIGQPYVGKNLVQPMMGGGYEEVPWIRTPPLFDLVGGIPQLTGIPPVVDVKTGTVRTDRQVAAVYDTNDFGRGTPVVDPPAEEPDAGWHPDKTLWPNDPLTLETSLVKITETKYRVPLFVPPEIRYDPAWASPRGVTTRWRDGGIDPAIQAGPGTHRLTMTSYNGTPTDPSDDITREYVGVESLAQLATVPNGYFFDGWFQDPNPGTPGDSIQRVGTGFLYLSTPPQSADRVVLTFTARDNFIERWIGSPPAPWNWEEPFGGADTNLLVANDDLRATYASWALVDVKVSATSLGPKGTPPRVVELPDRVRVLNAPRARALAQREETPGP